MAKRHSKYLVGYNVELSATGINTIYPKTSWKVVEDGHLKRKFFTTFHRVRQSQRDKELLERRNLYTDAAVYIQNKKLKRYLKYCYTNVNVRGAHW